MEWDPAKFFHSAPPSAPYAVLVLNQPINHNAWNILKKHACFTICADGGANRFYEMMKRQKRESAVLPDAIVGDLDSIHPEVRAHYESLKVRVVQDPDQYSTDFKKCLQYLNSNKQRIVSAAASSPSQSLTQASTPIPSESKLQDDSRKDLDVVVLGGLGGRVDQAFSQLHQLYISSQLAHSDDAGRHLGSLYLVSEEGISFILRQGPNTILTPGGARFKNGPRIPKGSNNNNTSHINDTCLSENIGIIPVSGPAVITTTGLEWDVQDWKTEFGGQLSTSNHIRDDVITVRSSTLVLFTVELALRLKFSGGADVDLQT